MLEFLLLWSLLQGDPTRVHPVHLRRVALDAVVDGLYPIPRELLERAYRKPELVAWMLPYPEWEAEYIEYFRRHCRDPRVRFRPTAICMHFTVGSSAEGVYNSFVNGANMWKGDGLIWGHPSVHLMVDKDGTVYQLLPLDWRCTGAYGVNHVALSIEMVALNERDLLSRPAQVFSSFCLVRSLMDRFGIPESKVYGHSEVGLGRAVVPDFLDYADKAWPDGYPPNAQRTDPGEIYMRWLRLWLRKS
ncbi:MAG: peptidoglycan recognition family protein [Candidatus Eremiobacterota bacterium]